MFDERAALDVNISENMSEDEKNYLEHKKQQTKEKEERALAFQSRAKALVRNFNAMVVKIKKEASGK